MPYKYHVGDPVIVNDEITFVESLPDASAPIIGYTVFGDGHAWPEKDLLPVPISNKVFEDYLKSYRDPAGFCVFNGIDVNGTSHVVELFENNHACCIDGQIIGIVNYLHELRGILSENCVNIFLPQYHQHKEDD